MLHEPLNYSKPSANKVILLLPLGSTLASLLSSLLQLPQRYKLLAGFRARRRGGELDADLRLSCIKNSAGSGQALGPIPPIVKTLQAPGAVSLTDLSFRGSR